MLSDEKLAELRELAEHDVQVWSLERVGDLRVALAEVARLRDGAADDARMYAELRDKLDRAQASSYEEAARADKAEAEVTRLRALIGDADAAAVETLREQGEALRRELDDWRERCRRLSAENEAIYATIQKAANDVVACDVSAHSIMTQDGRFHISIESHIETIQRATQMLSAARMRADKLETANAQLEANLTDYWAAHGAVRHIEEPRQVRELRERAERAEAVVARVREVMRDLDRCSARLRHAPYDYDRGRSVAYEDARREIEAALRTSEHVKE